MHRCGRSCAGLRPALAGSAAPDRQSPGRTIESPSATRTKRGYATVRVPQSVLRMTATTLGASKVGSFLASAEGDHHGSLFCDVALVVPDVKN